MGRMIWTRPSSRDRDGERDALDHDVRAFVGHGRRCDVRARVWCDVETDAIIIIRWDRGGWRRAKARPNAFIFIVLLRVVYGEMKWWWCVCLWFSVDPLV